MAKKFYSFDELKYKSHYDLYQICKNEKLIEGVLIGKSNKNQLINLILKYRGEKPKYTINESNEYGLVFLQDLFDSKLNIQLHDNYAIKIPHKIVLYNQINITKNDKYSVILPEYINNKNAFLVNSKNYLCGIFGLERDNKHKNKFYLTSEKELFRLDDLKNENFSLVFFKEVDSKFLYDFYYGRTQKYPHTLDYYKIKVNQFEIRDIEDTRAILSIDFGSTNTTAGVYLDQFYVSELPFNDIQNGNVKINEINYVNFPSLEEEGKSVLYPSLVYIQDCSSQENIRYLFGHDVNNELKNKNYILNGTIIYKMKTWIHELDKDEKVVDSFGNIMYIPRRDIIGEYMKNLLNIATYQFKCNFKNIHIITPVKLKEEYLSLFSSVLPEFNILRKNVLDEGISVMYNTIEKHLKKDSFENDEEYKAFIIDCGGATTELATCKFKINRSNSCIKLGISTSFENSEENFGGNNITYRILQFIKILLAQYYSKCDTISIDTLIPYSTEEIFRYIDQNGVESIYEVLDEEYRRAENIIPTMYGAFENKSSNEYKMIKNNYYFLWEVAEKFKEYFYTKNNLILVKFDSAEIKKVGKIDVIPLKMWKLHIIEDGKFKEMNAFPSKQFNAYEINKLIKGDIYEIIRKFMTPYYESGEIFDYSVIKLSGQSCKIPIFNEVLKEFVPGKFIDYKVKNNINKYDLKLNCLNGAITYLNSARFGDIRVEMLNEIPSIPFSIYGVKYTGEEIEVLKVGNKMNQNFGYVEKSSNASEARFKLYTLEHELKREYVYVNSPYDYIEKTAEEIIDSFEDRIQQRDLDTIENNSSKFFVYTSSSSWGYFVQAVKREEDLLYIGKKDYFPFDNRDNSISFFDGKH